MRWALTIQPLTRTCANLAYFPCVHDTSSSYMPRAASYSLLLPLPICHRGSIELFPLIRLMAFPILLLSLLICHQEAAQTPFMLRKSRGKNFHLDCQKKKMRPGVNGTHRFSLRGSDSASSGRGKIPEPWPMLERVKPYGEHSERGFYPQAKIRPDWGSNWRPCGERHYRVWDSQLATLPFSILIASIRTNPTYH